MDELLKKLLSKVDKEEVINELKKDKDFNKLMEMFSELFGGNEIPTIKIEMKPNDDNESHSLAIETRGSMSSVIFGLSEIVAKIMVEMDKKGVLRKDAYEHFGKLVKAQAEEMKKEN